MEKWKWIPEYVNSYCVSTNGRVMSNRRLQRAILKPFFTHKGYAMVDLFQKHIAVHRLVMETFVGPLPKGLQTRHLDGDKTNNALTNLKYDTQSNNRKDLIYHGVTKLSVSQVRWIRKNKGRFSTRRMGRYFNVSGGTICNIQNRKKHYAHVR